jgi:hypothetical protein
MPWPRCEPGTLVASFQLNLYQSYRFICMHLQENLKYNCFISQTSNCEAIGRKAREPRRHTNLLTSTARCRNSFRTIMATVQKNPKDFIHTRYY